MTPPYDYDYRNTANSLITPSTVHVAASAAARFFKRGLLQRAISPYEIVIPENWEYNYFTYSLFGLGFISIIKTDKFGVIPQNCSLSGYSVQYQPTRAIITNPLFDRTYDLRIGVDCTLIKMAPDYGGLMDIVDYYGNLLALTLSATEMNLINSKLAYVFMAKDTATAETLKKLYDEVQSGNPAVVAGKKAFTDEGDLNMEFFSQSLKENFITPDLLETIRTLLNMFDTEVGIPNANLAKKERMNQVELTMNDSETYARINVWMKELQKGFADAREMFGYTEEQLSIKLKEVEKNESNDDDPGTV